MLFTIKTILSVKIIIVYFIQFCKIQKVNYYKNLASN